MLKMRGRDSSGHPIIIIGLSRQNLDRLRWGEPISFSLKELAFDGGAVLIFSGATEDDMTHEFLEVADRAGVVVETGPPKKRRL